MYDAGYIATQHWPNHTIQVCTGCIEELNQLNYPAGVCGIKRRKKVVGASYINERMEEQM